MFMATLFTIAEKWKQPRRLLVDGYITHVIDATQPYAGRTS